MARQFPLLHFLFDDTTNTIQLELGSTALRGTQWNLHLWALWACWTKGQSVTHLFKEAYYHSLVLRVSCSFGCKIEHFGPQLNDISHISGSLRYIYMLMVSSKMMHSEIFGVNIGVTHRLVLYH